MVQITADDLTQTTTNTAQTLTTDIQFGIGTYVERVTEILPTPFQDVSDNAFNSDTMSVGDSVGGVATILAAIELNLNGTEILNKTAVPSGTPSTGFTAATFLTVTFNSMSGKALNDINKGLVNIGITAHSLKLLSDDAPYGPLQTKS